MYTRRLTATGTFKVIRELHHQFLDYSHTVDKTFYAA